MKNSDLSLFLGFNNKYVADLAFLLLSPSLQEDASFDLKVDSIQLWKWLEHEDLSPSNISSEFKDYPYRLGWYAESLLNYFFTNSSFFEIKHKNFQIFKGNKTVAELDFVLEDTSTNDLIHIETAIKFYLKYQHPDSDLVEFLGPDTSDSLEKKNDKIYNKQIIAAKKSQIPPGNYLIETVSGGDRDITDRKTCFKGILFYPLQEFRNKEFPYPDYINPQHLKAWYLKLDELIETTEINKFYPIEKLDWLSLNYTKSYDKKDFIAYCYHEFEKGKTAIMLRLENGERGIIVPASWPN